MSRHFGTALEPETLPEPETLEPTTDELIQQFYDNILWEPDYENLPETK